MVDLVLWIKFLSVILDLLFAMDKVCVLFCILWFYWLSIYDYSHACDDVLHDFMDDFKIVDNKVLKCMFGWRIN